jgi:3-hydroxybutyryl-CoA dehydratase
MAIKVTPEMIAQFIELTGDNNKIHTDADYAATTKFKQCIVHGTLIGGIIGAQIARKYPGCVLINQYITYKAPIYVNEKFEVFMYEIEREGRRVVLHIVIDGKLTSIARIYEAV